jgi:serine protease AprX
MRLWQAGVVVVSSAGNNGKDMGITVPGNNPYVITVGAVTDGGTPYDVSDDRITSFSAKGPTYEGFIKPEVVTYGSNISTKIEQRYLKKALKKSIFGEDYAEVSGTSQAAALVTGVAALVLSNDPYATPDEVKCRIMSTATPAASQTALTYSPFAQGAGLVNAYAAVMSTATNCGNKSLNIEEDLLGVNHFIGPAKVDNEGSYYIELADGTLYTKGVHWGEGAMDVQGVHWGEGAMDLQSTDLAVDPIDPTVEVPIVVDGWQ